MKIILYFSLLVSCVYGQDFLKFDGVNGKHGNGKHIVLIAGDHEYRSEEYLPMMAQILSTHHGFTTSVLFSQDADGNVDPASNVIPGMEELETADAVILGLRFRDLSNEDFTRFNKAIQRGVSILSTRTTTHAFKTLKPEWKHLNFNSKEEGWVGGFGRQVLGESWVNHHGRHNREGTLTEVEKGQEGNSILNGVGPITGPTDVYGADPLEPEAILLRGLVTEELSSEARPVEGAKNSPPMPVAWTKLYKNESGKTNKVFTTTLGSGIDFADEDLRRLLVNATYWATGLDVPERAEVNYVKRYEPQHFRSKKWRVNHKPSDFIELTEPKFTIPFWLKKKAIEIEASTAAGSVTKDNTGKLELNQGQRIALIGGGLFSRMMKFSEFETEMYLRYPKLDLVFRNQADEGDTPAFRPHASRPAKRHFAYRGAKELVPRELSVMGTGVGHRLDADGWLENVKADVILACFGSNEHFRGEAGLKGFTEELQGLIDHTKQQKYNGVYAPELVLVTPTAFQDLSDRYDVPNGVNENKSLKLYSDAIVQLAKKNGLHYIDLFSPTKDKFKEAVEYTRDGALLNKKGYEYVANILAKKGFSAPAKKNESVRETVFQAVVDKNWHWHNLYKMPNGIHVEGRRYNPHGPANYPFEADKLGEMIKARDRAIHASLQNLKYDLEKADRSTGELPEITSNFNSRSKKAGSLTYKSGRESLQDFTVPDGYEIELFADEKQFPNLANPCQMSFDAKGRLWVAVMPSYPHWKPGDVKPTDKLLIYEDTDSDGEADKEIVFSDQLHLMPGFELVTNKLGQQEVYCSQGDSLILLTDTDGDDKADKREIIMSGFDDHDSHHAISAFTADPGGGIIMGEGLYLMSAVETAYGVVRGTNGGFMRYDPNRRHLERTVQEVIPNPWGITHDDYGQPFFIHTSGSKVGWMTSTAQKPIYNHSLRGKNILTSGRVRPTAGIELMSSSHFPDEVQGGLLISNVIGFKGVKQHLLNEKGTGFSAKFYQDLVSASDPNVRPADLEIAPDGSLYLLDWHNPLIGHMQHNARDPNRDRIHGRIFRITYPSRPLVQPAVIHDASIETLLSNLTLPESRTRYRTRRELRSRNVDDVIPLLKEWVSGQKDERLKLEALWVSWGVNRVDIDLLSELSQSDDHKIRAAVLNVIRYNLDKIPNYMELLKHAAADEHGRVRLTVTNIASLLPRDEMKVLYGVLEQQPDDALLSNPIKILKAHIDDVYPTGAVELTYPSHIRKKADKKRYKSGHEIYGTEGFCGTCHQENGMGTPSAQIPPLRGAEWVTGDLETFIKIALFGIHGPVEVKGEEYNSAMTGFGPMINNEDMANLLYYIGNSWGHVSEERITAHEVSSVREEYKDRVMGWTAEELKK